MPVFVNPTLPKTVTGEFPTVTIDHGWPDAHLRARPNDALGQSILDFANAYRDRLPASPWDDRTGKIRLVPLDVVRPAADEVPIYRVKVPAAFLGPNLYTAGQEISYPSWPDHPNQLEAVNESAQLVLDYMGRHGAGVKLAGPVLRSGKLNMPNPALRGSPVSPMPRWAGDAVAAR